MISAIIVMLIGQIKFKKMLKKCLISNNINDIELFEYKGKLYDKNKFVKLKSKSLLMSGMSKKDMIKQLDKYKSNLTKSKTPDLDMALIQAYEFVLS